MTRSGSIVNPNLLIAPFHHYERVENGIKRLLGNEPLETKNLAITRRRVVSSIDEH